MKKSAITITLLFMSTTLISENVAVSPSELSWVDEQVKAIKPARSGAKDWYLGSIHNPFVFLKKVEKKSTKTKTATSTKVTSKKTTAPTKTKKLALEAIINKSALIDGKWYQEGETIYGYKLEKVSGRNVLLKKSQKSVLLTTKSELRSLKFNNN
jgi:hypothetical protein